jgi:hypothetical protein
LLLIEWVILADSISAKGLRERSCLLAYIECNADAKRLRLRERLVRLFGMSNLRRWLGGNQEQAGVFGGRTTM